MRPNTVLMESMSGLVNLRTVLDPWHTAMDVVNYPVEIAAAFYQVTDSEGRVGFEEARGETNTGRNKNINLILVDKYREGNWQAIQAVTDIYGTMKTNQLYADLKSQLNEIDYDVELEQVWVSGNGGSQQLLLSVKGLNDVDGCKDKIEMRMVLSTSVDGTKSHSLRVLAQNVDGDYAWNVFGTESNLKARHTTTIEDRTVNFVPQVTSMIKQWDETIMPTINLLCDRKYDASFVLDILDGIAEASQIGEQHREKIMTIFKTRGVTTNESLDSLYAVNACLNQYIEEELDGKRELQDRFRTNVSRHISNELNKDSMTKKLRHKSA